MKLRWLWLLLPLGVGGGLGYAFTHDWLPNPTAYLRADLAALSQLCGLGMALLVAFILWVSGWVASARAETRQQIAEQAAQDRRRFLQRLDHELKNPLTAIQAGLANLKENPTPAVMESVTAQTLRLSRLVSDLRKLSDLETRPIESAPVDLGEILQSVVELASEGAAIRSLKLSLSLPQAPWPLPQISGDGDLLLLAFHNLLDNAMKFSEPGDTIEVRAFEDGETVVVEVADTGPGIPEEELGQIWQELYRGERARGVPGSGLGLALVHGIIERHNGRTAVRSRLEQGTVVSVRLPAGHHAG